MENTNHFLERFFSPNSVAIVGATGNPLKMNFRILENLVSLKYSGKIYPVNPHTKEILGVKVFECLQDVPEKLDLVVSAVPAQKTMDIIKQSNDIGVKHLVMGSVARSVLKTAHRPVLIVEGPVEEGESYEGTLK